MLVPTEDPMTIEPVIDSRSNPEKDDELANGKIMERTWGLEARVDPTVTFEEYTYWAEIERMDEVARNRQYVEKNGPVTLKSVLKGRFSHGIHHEERKEREKAEGETSGDDKGGAVVVQANDLAVTEEEWKTAARALKTASWGTVFFLITTDILGWGSTPYAFSTVGYGPGVALYIIFSIAAGISGWILWRVYMRLDSSRYPILSYGDPFFRVFGKKSRHFINVTQAFQQFLTVAVLVLGSGQIIAQLSGGKICYIVCFVIFTAFGIFAGLMRGLQHVGWLANGAVWLNITSFIIVMVAAANFPVDYQVTTANTLIHTVGPIKTFAGPPPTAYQPAAVGFAGQLNGINQMVYSWGGALLFVAFLAEMRHPMDFWKGLICAQFFICIVYVFFGVFVYSFYGQYSAQIITTAVQPFSLQTVGNVFSLLTSAIACIMYFNIGMKTVYIEVFQEVFSFPPITTRRGRWMWYALGPVYWIVAFIVAASVPNLNGVSGLVGALLILNFTYTFPAILWVGYSCQIGARLPGEGFNPVTRVTTRLDNGWTRWVRGYTKSLWLNIASTLYFMGGLALSGMGTWAAIEALILFFNHKGSKATSWGCVAPV
ncbi:transmembrane amino acid transporter [Penicillium cinerascens]|uniref:Transmembrane amino acid transporter n=1 Tax=Penicillium cinerascens TaxID=70096 RepID=A0A9W9MDD9_9EURO|nr:transmembrane amino acid transporter [Penicillium cinerascens]KAJ5197843.1 transmembrane amino acid transporter [Penicillium cinerascens]